MDENKLNNCATNLRWTTNKENLEWGTIKERRKATIKECSEIKDFIFLLYRKYKLKYDSSKIRIKKLKKIYKVRDNLNDIIFKFSIDDIDLIINYNLEDIVKAVTLQISLKYKY